MVLSQIQEYALKFLKNELELQHPFLSSLANALLYEMKNSNEGKVYDATSYETNNISLNEFQNAIKELEFYGFKFKQENQTGTNFPTLELLIEETILNIQKNNKSFAEILKQFKADGPKAIITAVLSKHYNKKRKEKVLFNKII